MNTELLERMGDALRDEMAYWDGFGVQAEWFIRADGRAALGVIGDADDMEIMSIDIDERGVAHTQSTGLVEFSTGGPEI